MSYPQARITLWLGLAALLLVAGCDQADIPTATDISDEPLAVSAAKGGAPTTPIPGQYIVVFKDNVADAAGTAQDLGASVGAEVLYTYGTAIKGFAARMPEQAVEGLQNNPNVDYIEPDGVVTVTGVQNNPPSWGLDRIDQRTGTDNTYNFGFDGSSVHVYILDTGIRTTHIDFGGRAHFGYDVYGGDGEDCNGHGTHVAGTVGGSDYGVAKGVSLYAVRVLDCNGSGTLSGVIAGVDWVTANHQSPAVANMSLSGSTTSSLNSAVANSVAAGVTYAVAAGNNGSDACDRSPASEPTALTVGSTTSSDARSSFSNYGTCVDVFAPGSGITSAWYTSDTAANTISGTSMASPHVAGVAALYLDENSSAGPTEVMDAIVSGATSGAVGNPGSGSPNLLLYSLDLTGTPPPPPSDRHVQVANVSVSVNGNRNRRGTATVSVTEEGGTGAGVTVVGEWSNFGETESGVTDASGNVTFTSNRYRAGTSEFVFCVTSLSGPNVIDDTPAQVCGEPGGGGEDPPGGDPPGGQPNALTVQDASKGKNVKADLSWSGGEARVHIYKRSALATVPPTDPHVTIDNTGAYTDNLGKNNTLPQAYMVCNEGAAAETSGECSAWVDIYF